MPTEEDLEQLVNEALDCGVTAERIKQLAEEAAGIEPSDELLGMYKSYCEELSQYDDTEYPEGQDERVYREYQANPNVRIIAITNGSMKVGFLILLNGEKRNECVICEAYVLPMYRGRGLMKTTLAKVLKQYNRIRFLVFNRNPAKGYWEKTLKELGRVKLASAPYDRQLTEYLYW